MQRVRKVEGNLYEFESSPSAQVVAQTTQLLLSKGEDAENAGQADAALGFYQQALLANPMGTDAILNIGRIAHSRGNWEFAEECYRKALEIDPSYAFAHCNLAYVLGEKSPPQRTEAIKHYEKALALQSNYPDAHYNLALEYESVGEERKALAHWRLYLRYGIGASLSSRAVAQRQIVLLEAALSQFPVKHAVSHRTSIPKTDSEAGSCPV